MNLSNIKAYLAQINPTIGAIDHNVEKILHQIERARQMGAQIVVFPELSITGYFPDDLLFREEMIESAGEALKKIEGKSQGLLVIVGTVRKNGRKEDKPLCNSAAIFIDGKLEKFYDKILLPTYDVFDERRYFAPGKEVGVFSYGEKKIGITICEDVWQHASEWDSQVHYLRDPVAELKKEGIDLLINISGSPYSYKREEVREGVFQKCAQTLHCPVLMCNQVGANDQLLFDGHSLFIDAKGEVQRRGKGFEEEGIFIDFGKKEKVEALDYDNLLYRGLCRGVRDYFQKQGFAKAVLGLSGGVDSALVACIAKDALGKENVIALAMPSRYTSKESVIDAQQLAKNLGIGFEEISIELMFSKMLVTMGPLFHGKKEDVTEENFQSRIRGMILMAYSNKFGALVLNGGNKSEMALGYATLYGDMVGAVGPLQDLTKSMVYRLAKMQKEIPRNILEKAPSAELKPGQKDTDSLPPYEVLDPIIEGFIEKELSASQIAKALNHPIEFVEQIVRKIDLAEYKRRQAPLVLRVTPKAFNKGRIVPIVQRINS